MYTLDTNPIIYYAKGDTSVIDRLEALMFSDILRISIITEIELFSRRDTEEAELDRLEIFLRHVSVVPPDSRIARMAAEMRRESNLKLADAVIAATALAY